MQTNAVLLMNISNAVLLMNISLKNAEQLFSTVSMTMIWNVWAENQHIRIMWRWTWRGSITGFWKFSFEITRI